MGVPEESQNLSEFSLSNRNNPYSFDEFLGILTGFDFYGHDPFLQKCLRHYCSEAWERVDDRLRDFSQSVSFRMRDLADHVARKERHPYIEHYDAHNHRVDRIVRPQEAHILEEEVFSEGLFSESMPDWESFVKRFILHELGEASFNCPLVCTEGLIGLLEAFPEGRLPQVEAILRHCKEGVDGEFGVGAQFMSEIQGGSDIPSNVLEAVPEGDHYRLYGTKYFCSAAHADYSIITAKVQGTKDVGAFVVPSWLPGNKAEEKRNDYRINRLKWKLGTAELPTGEIEYDGAVAYAVGPTDRGVANAVGIVLTLSRITVGASSAAVISRAAREALVYSEFRDVFGRRICEWALANQQVRDMVDAAQRATAGVFKIYNLHLRLGKRLQAGLTSDEPLELRRERFNLRELIILQKICAAYEASDVIREAISIFGGHGVIEDFSALPRLFRDAMVNELWEGPRNVLLMQIYRDLLRVASWYPSDDFVASILAGAPKETVAELSNELSEFLRKPPFFELNAESRERSAQWDAFCDKLFKAYQTVAADEVGREPIVSPDKMMVPSAWADR